MNTTDLLFGEFRSITSRRLCLGILAFGLICRLWVSWQPVDILVTKNLPDDAFYYFVLAQNSIQQGNISMDGMSATNGFHPLWLLIIAPIFGLAESGSDLPIHIALTLASFIDLLSIWLIAQLAAAVTKQWSMGLIAAWLYAINPIVILQTTNGLETSLGILTLLIFLCLFRNWLTQKRNQSLSLLVGVSGGLMFLARSDSLFLFGFALIGAALYWGTADGKRRIFLTGITSLLVVSPWLIWSYSTVGSIFQESGSAVPYSIRINLALEKGMGWRVVLEESIRQLSSRSVWLRGDFSGLPLIFGVVLWGFLAIGLVKRWKAYPNRLEQAILLPLLGSGLALIMAHAGVRWYPRPWYFMSSSVAFALCFALVGSLYLNKPRIIFWATTITSVVFIFAGYIFWQIGYFPWQREMLAASNWLSQNISTEARVGSFNSGIYSYYNTFQVVNLDGVVNHDAYVAIQEMALLPYMHSRGVGFLVDSDLAIWTQYAVFMGAEFSDSLDEIAILGDELSADLGFLRIYQIE